MSALGRYELLRPLARGGMAEVYLARRRVAGVEKRLVIKRLRKDRSRDPRFLELFMREAQLSMSLVQQNIVPVFDFGRIGDDVFLAMEHIDGKDLGSSLAKERGAGLSPLVAAFIASECCQALDHAHRRPEAVIHRDVTPRNVLLSWEGEVKLADFGIAAVVGDASGALGTPGYMAPEQARAEPTDARVDIYALGIVLWEAVIGEHVRPSTDRNATIAAAKSGQLPAIDPELVPDDLAAIIRHATATDPAQRYTSARNMAEALDAFLLAERARDPGPAPAQRLAEWLRQRWGDMRDEASAPMPAAAGAVVSFVDDGLDKLGGSRTLRSIAETAADEADVTKTPPPHAIIEDAPADLYVAAPASATIVGRRWLPLLVVLAIVGAAVAYILSRRPAATTVPPDAGLADARVDVAPPDVAPPVDGAPDGPPDARSTPDARVRVPGDAARTVVRPDVPVRSAGQLRPILIGAVPWAYFTVDDDPKQYETPMTLRLAVGTHRVTFTNPQLGVSRTVTVSVPADGDARHVEKMN
ncbi:MAG TPA: protein kinase [Kofleriaceae bacterium]|nr:protein kinase [Kofleriaceae bacterium]